MLVMTLERVPPALRGELTRWLVEIQTGVYVGRVSAMVRDNLWRKAIDKARGGQCTQTWRANTELGVEFRISGDERRQLVDFDGLTLVSERNRRWETYLKQGKLGARADT